MTDVDRRRIAIGAGIVLVVATAVVSGVSTFLNAYAVKGTGSDAFVTVRNLAVAAMLVPLAVLGARRSPVAGPVRRAELLGFALVGVVGGAVAFLLFFHGLALAAAAHGATTASFLYRTLFLFAGLFAVVALRERLRARYLAGAALLLGGGYVLLSLGSPVWTDGSLWVLLATVLWAGEYTLSKRLLRRFPSTTVGFARMGIGALVLVGYLTATAQWGNVATFGPDQWTWVAISAVLLAAFVSLWYAGLARIDLHVATAFLVLGYPVTWLLSVLAGNAAVTPAGALGTVAVLAGAGLVAGVAYLAAGWAWVVRPTPAPDR